MAVNGKSFRSLAGVPLHYARRSAAEYGTQGRPYTFFGTGSFHRKLEDCFAELFQVCPYGPAEVITCAGVYVNKANSYHQKGRAFDLDALFWADRTFVTLHYPQEVAFYLAVEAILRKHFGTVLNYLYNDRHQNHLHFDDGTPVGFDKNSKSRLLFVQAVCGHLYQDPLLLDGRWGNQTREALGRTLEKMELSGNLETKEVWLAFLDTVAAKGFGQEIPQPTPEDLLLQLYSLLNEAKLEPEQARVLTGAFTAFSTHEETVKWLEGFRVVPVQAGEKHM
jgi:hypothetical protein